MQTSTSVPEVKRPTTEPLGTQPTQRGGREFLARASRSQNLPIFVALLAVIAVMSVLSDRFLNVTNLTNVLAQSAVVGVAAVGATFVIITAGIDLSVGSAIALSGILGGLTMQATGDGFLGMIVVLVAATLIGAFNGFSIAYLNLAPFIVTLATLGMAAGLTLQLSNGQPIFGLPETFNWLGSARVAGIPVAAFVTVFVFIIGHIILTRTTFGHRVFAIGGNREAARLAGIRDKRTLFYVYTFAGLCAGLAGILLAGRLSATTPIAAQGLELQVIAAVVIGGTSLFGGKGSLLGTLIGVLLIGFIGNGLTLMNVGVFWVQFVQAALIFVAVLLDSVNNRRLARAR